MLELLLRIIDRKINAWLDEISPCILEFGPGLFRLCHSPAGQDTAVAGCSHHPSPSCATSSSKSSAGGHPAYPPSSVATSFSLETPFQPSFQVIGSRKLIQGGDTPSHHAMSLPTDQKRLSQLRAGRCAKPPPRAPRSCSTSTCKVLPLGRVKFIPKRSLRSRGKPRSIPRTRAGCRHLWFVLGGDHPCDSPARWAREKRSTR